MKKIFRYVKSISFQVKWLFMSSEERYAYLWGKTRKSYDSCYDFRYSFSVAANNRRYECVSVGILLTIAIIVLVLWLLGFIFFKSIGGIIHIALIVGVILLIIWLLRAVVKLF